MTIETQQRLLSCKSLSEFMTMYWGLGLQDKLSVFPNEVVVPVGTCFYRIRKAKEIRNPDDSKEWGPVPKDLANQGRFNSDKESVLYTAFTPYDLEREVRLREGEEYYLAKYCCKAPFKVGCFLETNNQVNTLLHKITMAVADDKEELTELESAMVDEYFEIAKNKNLFELSMDLLASFYIHKLIPNIYDVTNRLGKLILGMYPCGIRYSSIYAPFEFSGAPTIITLDGIRDGNCVLTEKGCENIDLVSVEKKVCVRPLSLDGAIEELIKAQINETEE